MINNPVFMNLPEADKAQALAAMDICKRLATALVKARKTSALKDHALNEAVARALFIVVFDQSDIDPGIPVMATRLLMRRLIEGGYGDYLAADEERGGTLQ